MPGCRYFLTWHSRKLAVCIQLNYRSHRKIVVIDGKIGYIGGMNLDKEQLPGGNRLGSWRDTHLRVEGETALALQATFAVSWYNTTQEIFDAETYFPTVDRSQLPHHSRANYIGRTRFAVEGNAAVVLLDDHDRRKEGPDPITLFHS